MDDPVGSGVSLLGQGGFCVARFDESVEGAVDEWPADREHPPQLGRGFELLGDGESVARSFGENTEDGMLGDGETGCGHGVGG